MARSKRPAPTNGQEAYRILRASQARLAATKAAAAAAAAATTAASAVNSPVVTCATTRGGGQAEHCGDYTEKYKLNCINVILYENT